MPKLKIRFPRLQFESLLSQILTWVHDPLEIIKIRKRKFKMYLDRILEDFTTKTYDS